jgi:hypothetical protein
MVTFVALIALVAGLILIAWALAKPNHVTQELIDLRHRCAIQENALMKIYANPESAQTYVFDAWEEINRHVIENHKENKK